MAQKLLFPEIGADYPAPNPTSAGARRSAKRQRTVLFDQARPLPFSNPVLRVPEAFRDPAFTENRTVPMHRWVPWIAGFSAQFVDDAIRTFVPTKRERRSLILDPFAGVGTTLVQAVRNGHDAVGYEINPYATLAARTKLAALKLNPGELDEVIDKLKTTTPRRSRRHRRQPPPGFRSRIAFFSKRVEPQILDMLELISEIPAGPIQDLARIALGSMMVSVSNYTYEPSLSSRPAAGKQLVEDADVRNVLSRKLAEMKQDILWIQQTSPEDLKGNGDVRCANFLAANGELATGSVDLVVTSPPYLNNYHYVRNSRPQMFWLSLVSGTEELRQLEEASFGKFWQTVRDEEPIPLRCDHVELATVVALLREIRADKGAYGGPGWANYVVSYFNDCDRFVQLLRRVLRRGGVAVVVIGNSIIQGLPIATDQILSDLAEKKKLKLHTIIPLRKKRVGASITTSSVRCGEQTDTTLYENAVVLRKR
jgi:tRNA G10  N-methylase Trm11